jgi:hypothetical protein
MIYLLVSVSREAAKLGAAATREFR